MNNSNESQIRVIRESECRKMTGLCRTTRYLMEKKGLFPARRKLGGRSIGWVLPEVVEWLRNQPKVVSDTDNASEII
ncbi:AlpA family phage regulatory protein [Morganella morganii]|uniref:helix-turn-helix transcriptional regulator n=1 Tax=Morganella morganii TaxID=582 RepID=UPI0021D2E8A4|nr:AlpA family phage regulatory protein [Morganella morganii]MCU6211073.1 AlpA family phage regulatory protein [Morganella morganii]